MKHVLIFISSDASTDKSSPLNVGISEGEDACEMDVESFKVWFLLPKS